MKKFSLFALTLALFTGCQQHTETNIEQAAEAVFPETQEWAVVEERPLTATLTLSGDIVADERRVARVVVPIGGRVQGVTVETGDHVARGTRLATVSSTEAAEHQRELQAAQSEVRLAQRELTMKEQLLQDGMASDKEVGEARERLRVAEAALNEQQAVAGIYSLNSSRGNSSPPSQGGAGGGSTLFAPIDGTILSREVYNDQFVEAGTEAFVIADLTRVWAVADVYETDISRIHEGDSVTVETMAWPGELFRGRIDKVYAALSAESKTMKVRIDLDNPDGRLRPGMFASVRVAPLSSPLGRKAGCATSSSQGGTGGGLLPCVPASAVIFENGHHYVIVKSDGTCRRQEVIVARETDGYVYLKEGVSAGQQVVAQNALLVFNQLGQ